MSRRAFTLIELLVVIGVMALMVTVGIVGIRAGQRAARVKGAARDLFAVIRHARSLALVTQQPAIITYSCTEEDGEPIAKIEITGAKILNSGKSLGEVQTLSGEPLKEDKNAAREETASSVKSSTASNGSTVGKGASSGDESSESGGETIEDVLFAPISTDIVKGMRLKVVMGETGLETEDPNKNKSKISVFSNVDYLLGKFKDYKSKESAGGETSDDKAKTDDKTATASLADKQDPVSVAWETNGRVDPHQVWIYPDGSTPEKGLSIKIDRFGGAKVLGGDERDDD